MKISSRVKLLSMWVLAFLMVTRRQSMLGPLYSTVCSIVTVRENHIVKIKVLS